MASTYREGTLLGAQLRRHSLGEALLLLVGLEGLHRAGQGLHMHCEELVVLRRVKGGSG